MTDDVEDTLASLEQRLRALQTELEADGEAAPAGGEPPREARRFAAEAFPPLEESPPRADRRFAADALPPLEEPAPRERRDAGASRARTAPSMDALDRFGSELRRLVDAWERTVAELRGDQAAAAVFRGGVALEARGGLPELCALDRALRAIDGVASVTLRAYAGGAAALEVALDRDVALVAELRRSLAFSVIAAGGGRLTISIG